MSKLPIILLLLTGLLGGVSAIGLFVSAFIDHSMWLILPAVLALALSGFLIKAGISLAFRAPSIEVVESAKWGSWFALFVISISIKELLDLGSLASATLAVIMVSISCVLAKSLKSQLRPRAAEADRLKATK